MYAALRPIVHGTVRAESAGHAATQAALSRHEDQAGAQNEGQEATGLNPEQRARGKDPFSNARPCFPYVFSP